MLIIPLQQGPVNFLAALGLTVERAWVCYTLFKQSLGVRLVISVNIELVVRNVVTWLVDRMERALEDAFLLQHRCFNRNKPLDAPPLRVSELQHPPQVVTVRAQLPPNLQVLVTLCYKLIRSLLPLNVPLHLLTVRLHPPRVSNRVLRQWQLKYEQLVPLEVPKKVLVVPLVLLQCPRLIPPHTISWPNVVRWVPPRKFPRVIVKDPLKLRPRNSVKVHPRTLLLAVMGALTNPVQALVVPLKWPAVQHILVSLPLVLR